THVTHRLRPARLQPSARPVIFPSCAYLPLLWQRKAKLTSPLGLGFDPDAPPVAIDDLLADRQPDSSSRVLGFVVQALEDHEDAFKVLRVDADALVLDAEEPR